MFIEKSCVRYWLCVGGYPRLQRCAAGLAVNPTSLKCELASTVPGCEPPPTTTPAEAEESSDSAGASQGNQAQANQPLGPANGEPNGQALGSLNRPVQSFPSPFRSSQSGQGGAGNGRLLGK